MAKKSENSNEIVSPATGTSKANSVPTMAGDEGVRLHLLALRDTVENSIPLHTYYKDSGGTNRTCGLLAFIANKQYGDTKYESIQKACQVFYDMALAGELRVSPALTSVEHITEVADGTYTRMTNKPIKGLKSTHKGDKLYFVPTKAKAPNSSSGSVREVTPEALEGVI